MATPLTQKLPRFKDKSKFFEKSSENYSNDFYHVKQCYQQQQSVPKTKATTPPSQCISPYSSIGGTIGSSINEHYQNLTSSSYSRTSSSITKTNIADTAATTSPVPSCLMHFNCRIGYQSACSSASAAVLQPPMWRRHWLIVVACVLLLHATTTTMAAPQSCILCDKNDINAKDPQRNYEEFLFEHQVTRQDAINALKQLNESFYDGKFFCCCCLFNSSK